MSSQTYETLFVLEARKHSFYLLTNGGGITEQARADYTGQILGVGEFEARKFVHCQTPWLDLVPTRADKNALIIWITGHRFRDTAHAYGFKQRPTRDTFSVEW